MNTDDHGENDVLEIDVLIVGGGPAGLTAATYLQRYYRSCAVVDDGNSRARWISESQNCAGFPEGVSGPDLLAKMREQASTFGARIIQGRIEKIEREEDRFRSVIGTCVVRSTAVILATGIRDLLPAMDDIDAAIACGALRLCPVCDAFEVTDRKIGIFGPAEKILEHGKFLRTYSATVALLPTGDGPSLREGAHANGLTVRPPGGHLTFDGRRIAYVAPGASPEEFDTIYFFLGGRNALALATGLGARISQAGEVEVDRHQMTSLRHLYAIGDVVTDLNQISVAVGHAAIASTHLHQALEPVMRAHA